MTAINLRNYTFRFNRRALFHNVTASIDWSAPGDGKIVGLMGPSGSGKTTLMKQVLESRYEGRSPSLEILPSDGVIGFVPQSPVLFAHLDVLGNARLFERVGRYASRFDGALFERLAATLGIAHLLEQKSHLTLSGGEAQRLMLLRTLAVRPDLLLLDEPAAGLDPSIREEFLVDLSALVAQLNIATLYIGHHWDEISFVAGRVAFLLTGMDESGAGIVSDVPVLPVHDFRERPPTPDAFQAVYGPGCEIVPVQDSASGVIRSSLSAESALIACVPPINGTRADQIIRTGPYRVPRTPGSVDAGLQTPRRAWIYKNRRFHAHANLAA